MAIQKASEGDELPDIDISKPTMTRREVLKETVLVGGTVVATAGFFGVLVLGALSGIRQKNNTDEQEMKRFGLTEKQLPRWRELTKQLNTFRTRREDAMKRGEDVRILDLDIRLTEAEMSRMRSR
jgi:hypothetical protein